MEILDDILTDNSKEARYASLIPVQNIQEWKFNITKELHDFFNSSGVSISYQNSDVKISLNSAAITKILFNEKVNLNTKSKMSLLAEDFLIVKNKVKPKQKKLV